MDFLHVRIGLNYVDGHMKVTCSIYHYSTRLKKKFYQQHLQQVYNCFAVECINMYAGTEIVVVY